MVILGLIGNILLATVKFVTGILGNSYALIADAIESTTDIFASLLVLVGIKYSAKPADENHPYGHGRAEALFTFIVVGFLIVAATVISFQSIINIQTPHESPESYTLIVLFVIILIKETLYRITSKKSRETNSSILSAEAWHHRSDAITSLFALVGISVAILFGDGYEIADDIAALIASAFIFYNAFRIFRPALGEIMDEHTHQELENQIRISSKEVQGVVDTEKCHIRKVGTKYLVDLHLIMDGEISVSEGHKISHDLKDHLMEVLPNIGNVLVHIEPARL